MEMTKGRIYDFIRGFNPLYVAIALSLLMLAAIILLKGASLYNTDSHSYVGAWNECYFHGEIDTFRTPVYPVLIGIGRLLFGQEYWTLFPTLLQTIIFYVCGILFSRMILETIPSRRIAWITIFVYFLFYPIVNSLPILGTEALGFSLTSAWLYCVWRFMERAHWGYGIAIALLTVTEIMLRPSLLILCFAIVGLAVAGMFFKRYRRHGLLLLVTLIPSGLVYKVYVDEMVRLTDYDSISIVSVYNRFFMARQFNDIYPEFLTDNPLALEVMQSYQAAGDSLMQGYRNNARWREIAALENSGAMDFNQMDAYVNAMKSKYPEVWYANTARRIANSFTHEGPVKNICNYLVVMLYTAFFVTAWIRLRRFRLVNFLILMIGGGSMLSILLYAQSDFGRLMLPTSAALILMGGQLLNCIRLHPLSISIRKFF